MPDWPQELQDLQLLGLTQQSQEIRLRSQMEIGPAKVRRRHTGVLDRYRIPVVLSGGQRDLLEEFYRVDLLGGSLPFIWSDPVTDAPTTFYFDEPPSETMEKGGPPGGRTWSGYLALRTAPGGGVEPTAPKKLLVRISSISTISADLTVYSRLGVSVASVSAIAASMDVQRRLVTSMVTTSSITAETLSDATRKTIVAAMASISTIQASMNVRRRLSASVATQSTIEADLTEVGAQLNQLGYGSNVVGYGSNTVGY